MPSVTINEKDYTIYNRQLSTDNIVYIPGFAITGPTDRPVLLESYRDLVNIFGNIPPEAYAPSASTNASYKMGTSWEYAAGLLNAGFLVLFRRIVPHAVNTEHDTSSVVSYADLGEDMPEELLAHSGFSVVIADDNIELLKIRDVFGGTYGDRYRFEIVRNAAGNKVFYKLSEVYNGVTAVEYFEICTKSDIHGENFDLISAIVSTVNEKSEKLQAFGYEFLDEKDNQTAVETNAKIKQAAKDFTEYVKNRLFPNTTATTKIPSKPFIAVLNKNIENKKEKDENGHRLTVYIDATLESKGLTLKGSDGKNFTINDFDLTTDDAGVAGNVKTVVEGDREPAHLGAILTYYLTEIEDKIQYDMKFVTKGCIPVNDVDLKDLSGTEEGTFANAVMNLCYSRGDCFYATEPCKGEDKAVLLNSDDNEGIFSCYNGSGASYVAAYAPWAVMTLFNGYNKWMPPSYTFLYALAKSVSAGNPVYLPPAGVNRMSVPEVAHVEYTVGSKLLNQWQNKDLQLNINPIMKLNNYGYVIYGQRTMYDVSDSITTYRSALQEVGVRLALIEIKKKIYNVAVGLTFEYNNIHTWNEFKSQLEPLLIQMQENGALQRFKVIMDATTTSPDDIDDNIIRGTVKVVPGRAAEDFIISFELYRSSVTFDDEETVNGY